MKERTSSWTSVIAKFVVIPTAVGFGAIKGADYTWQTDIVRDTISLAQEDKGVYRAIKPGETIEFKAMQMIPTCRIPDGTSDENRDKIVPGRKQGLPVLYSDPKINPDSFETASPGLAGAVVQMLPTSGEKVAFKGVPVKDTIQYTHEVKTFFGLDTKKKEVVTKPGEVAVWAKLYTKRAEDGKYVVFNRLGQASEKAWYLPPGCFTTVIKK